VTPHDRENTMDETPLDTVAYAPIGVVRSPHARLAGMPLQSVAAQDVHGHIELLPRYEPALRDLDGFSYSERKGFAIGDTLTLPPPGGRTRWVVVGVADDPHPPGRRRRHRRPVRALSPAAPVVPTPTP